MLIGPWCDPHFLDRHPRRGGNAGVCDQGRDQRQYRSRRLSSRKKLLAQMWTPTGIWYLRFRRRGSASRKNPGLGQQGAIAPSGRANQLPVVTLTNPSPAAPAVPTGATVQITVRWRLPDEVTQGLPAHSHTVVATSIELDLSDAPLSTSCFRARLQHGRAAGGHADRAHRHDHHLQVFQVSEGIKRSTTSGGDAQQNGVIALYSMERDFKNAEWDSTTPPSSAATSSDTTTSARLRNFPPARRHHEARSVFITSGAEPRQRTR